MEAGIMSTNLPIGGSETQQQQRVPTIAPTIKAQTETQKLELNKINNAEEIRAAESKGNNIPISDEQLVKAIERAIKSVQGPTTFLDFSVHKETKQIMVKVLDKDTGEIIREIPPEKHMDFLAKLWEMAGILVDERR